MTSLLHFDVCGNNLFKIVQKCYVVTVDEQLIPFRGCCSFKQYMPSKPDKYGTKLFLLYDCLTGYTFNGKPYLGRQGNQRNVGLASDVVKILSSPLHFSGINITMDNWFTSSQLAADLLQKQVTLLGTMRKNRRELPCEFATGKRRSVGSSLFGFSDRQTLVSHVPRKNKAVVLLSTMHNDKKVDEETGLPEMILDYNATKAAVDRVDQLCHNYSVQKRTMRWPLAYFYYFLNIAGINSMVIFRAKFSHGESQATHGRRVFLENLGMSLLHPWLQRRVQEKQLPKDTKLALQKCRYKTDIEALSQLHTKVESVKADGATSAQLQWIDS